MYLLRVANIDYFQNLKFSTNSRVLYLYIPQLQVAHFFYTDKSIANKYS